MTQSNFVLTGSIASGKSTVLDIIKEQGYMTISADDVVKELYKREDFLLDFKEHIGEEYFIDKLNLDTSKLRRNLFTDDAFKARVEDFVHPRVYECIKEKLDDGINFIEVPLYFEAKKHFNASGIMLQGVIYVCIDKDLELKRLMQRNKLSLAEAKNRLDKRLSQEYKIKNSDYIIENNKGLKELKEEVLKTLERINEKVN